MINRATTLTATISAGSNISYTWNFGDGSVIGFGSILSHTYPTWGNFTAMVTATNSVSAVMTTTPIVIVPYRLYLPLVLNDF